MEEDREKGTIRKRLVDVRKCISNPDIVDFASELYQDGLISHASYNAAITSSGTPPGEKTAQLVSEAMNKISNSPDNFSKFVFILESRDMKLVE